jgi:hypothetical protein
VRIEEAKFDADDRATFNYERASIYHIIKQKETQGAADYYETSGLGRQNAEDE